MRTPYPNELMHHGIKGQKWGVRRFQNPDGSWTEEGRRRYGVSAENGRANTISGRFATAKLNAKSAKERRKMVRAEKTRIKDERWAKRRSELRSRNDAVLANARNAEEAESALRDKIRYDLQDGMTRKQARRDTFFGTTDDDSERIAKMVIKQMNDKDWASNRAALSKGWKVADTLFLGALSNPASNGKYQREGYKNLDAAYAEFKSTVGLELAKEFAKRDRETEYYAELARQRAQRTAEP